MILSALSRANPSPTPRPQGRGVEEVKAGIHSNSPETTGAGFRLHVRGIRSHSNEVFEPPRAVNNSLYHDAPVVCREENEVAAVHGLSEALGKISAARIGLRQFADARADGNQF